VLYLSLPHAKVCIYFWARLRKIGEKRFSGIKLPLELDKRPPAPQPQYEKVVRKLTFAKLSSNSFGHERDRGIAHCLGGGRGRDVRGRGNGFGIAHGHDRGPGSGHYVNDLVICGRGRVRDAVSVGRSRSG
jgi:hypothetical protein